MNPIILLVLSMIVMLLAIVTMIVSDRVLDTSTTRMQFWLVICIASELVAFESNSWFMFCVGAVSYVCYIFIPRKHDSSHGAHNHHH